MQTLSGLKTTMIGSMPHPQPGEAFKLLQKYPLDIPSWPQFPKRSFKEGMIPQFSEGFPGITIDQEAKTLILSKKEDYVEKLTAFYEAVVEERLDYFALTSEFAAGFQLFCDEISRRSQRPAVVKGQVTGPFTFGLGINDDCGRSIWYDEEYRDVVLNGLILKGKWQLQKLQALADRVLIFYDEPILSGLGTSSYLNLTEEHVVKTLNEVIDAMHATGASVGSHCCGNTDWGLLARTNLDIIAFDAYGYGDKVALYADDIKSYLQRGGFLAWGLIPTLDTKQLGSASLAGIEAQFQRLIKVFADKGISEPLLREQMLITPACGMGFSLDTAEAEKVLYLLQASARF